MIAFFNVILKIFNRSMFRLRNIYLLLPSEMLNSNTQSDTIIVRFRHKLIAVAKPTVIFNNIILYTISKQFHRNIVVLLYIYIVETTPISHN